MARGIGGPPVLIGFFVTVLHARACSVGARWYTCGVLLELRIENLLLIERAELRPGDGLTAITGETGAGKTVLAHALDLLLGGKARPGIVRPGAADAYVEGVFELPAGLLDEPQFADLRERVGEDLDEIVLARRVSEKRTTAFVQGRSATAADLQALGGRLVAFFGHTSTGGSRSRRRSSSCSTASAGGRTSTCGRRSRPPTRGSARSSAGWPSCVSAPARATATWTCWPSRSRRSSRSARTRRRRPTLAAERARLRELDGLLAAAGAGAEAIAPSGDSLGVSALLASAEQLAGSVQEADPEMDALGTRLTSLRLEAEDLGAELRRYADSLEGEPGRLDVVEERLELYDRLERKHGGSVAAVLAHAERCREEHARLAHAEIETERAEAALAEALAERDRLAKKVTAARRKAAPKLAERVREELAALAMEGAAFEVILEPGRKWLPWARSASSFSSRPTRACPRRRSAMPLRAASCRG